VFDTKIRLQASSLAEDAEARQQRSEFVIAMNVEYSQSH
jgi:hypothetical protein